MSASIGLQSPRVREILVVGAGVDSFEGHAENHVLHGDAMLSQLEPPGPRWPIRVHGAPSGMHGLERP